MREKKNNLDPQISPRGLAKGERKNQPQGSNDFCSSPPIHFTNGHSSAVVPFVSVRNMREREGGREGGRERETGRDN